MTAYIGDEIYILNPAARLRNEGKYVIAAFPDALAVPILRLDPLVGVVVSLLDGKRTCDEVVDISSVMVHDDSSDPVAETKTMLANVLKVYVQPQGGVAHPLIKKRSDVTSAQLAGIPSYRPPDFIIRPQDYKPEDMQLSFPVSLLWLLTNDCQTNCQYCYMHKPQVARKDLLPFERLKEIVQEAYDGGIMGIYPSGGDVLCYPYLFEFLDLMDQYGFEPTVLPTKAYVSEETAHRLTEYTYMKDLQLSIDSTVPEIADFMTQSPGFCERTLKSIRNAQNAGLTSIQVKTVITPYNVSTIPKLYRDLKAMGVSRITLATYCRSGYHHKEKLFNHPDDYLWLDDQLQKLREEFPEDKILYQNGPPQLAPKPKEKMAETWKNRASCTAGRTNITICATGKVVPCEQMPEREGDYLGDLRTQSLREVWLGKELDGYLLHPPRDKFANTACHDCEEFDECQSLRGQCVRDSVLNYGTRWCPTTICPRAPEEYMRQM